MKSERTIDQTDPTSGAYIGENPFAGTSLEHRVRSYHVGKWTGNGRSAGKNYISTSIGKTGLEEESVVQSYLRARQPFGDEIEIDEPKHRYKINDTMLGKGLTVTGMNAKGEAIISEIQGVLQNLGFEKF